MARINTITATMSKMWIKAPAMWKPSHPSNQSTTINAAIANNTTASFQCSSFGRIVASEIQSHSACHLAFDRKVVNTTLRLCGLPRSIRFAVPIRFNE
jgi:hypothetical protein